MRALLGVVARLLQTSLGMSEAISQIARRRLEGRKPAFLEPHCLDPKLVNGFVVRAVCWMAALRERLRVRAGVKAARGAGVTQGVKLPCTPRPARGDADRDAGGNAGGGDMSKAEMRWATAAAKRLGAIVAKVGLVGDDDDDADDFANGEMDGWADRWAAARKKSAPAPHRAWSLGGQMYDLRELSRPLRVDAVNLTYGREAIAGLSDAAVIAQVCSDLVRATHLLGEEDVAAIHVLARAALSLCPPEDVEHVTLMARRAGERTVLELLAEGCVPAGMMPAGMVPTGVVPTGISPAPRAAGCGPPDG